MHEIITLQVGQAGVRLGNSLWELFCLEHGISENGTRTNLLNDGDGDCFRTFFNETASGRYVPRTLFTDCEDSVVNNLKKSGKIFDSNNIVNGLEDSSSIYARGRFSVGKELMARIRDRLRKLSENTDSLQGFVLLHGLGGGTGSGLTSSILEHVSKEYGSKKALTYSILPSPMDAMNVTEPYNSILSFADLLEFSSMNIVVDNNSLYRILQTKLEIEMPSLAQTNDLLSHSIGHMTSGMRFDSCLNANLQELYKNLVPFPQLQYCLTSLAPLMNKEGKKFHTTTLKESTVNLFRNDNVMANCDIEKSKYLSATLQYGGDISSKEVCQSIGSLKDSDIVKFTSWSPVGFKVGMCSHSIMTKKKEAMADTRQSCSAIFNNASIRGLLSDLCCRFDQMHWKRAFIFWYIMEGMEEGEFSRSREAIQNVQDDYDEVI